LGRAFLDFDGGIAGLGLVDGDADHVPLAGGEGGFVVEGCGGDAGWAGAGVSGD
jgi:hypothetical protein